MASDLQTQAALPRRTAVSHMKPGGMILSTGNLYFTSHDERGAHVVRMAQTSGPGQEIELYREPPGNEFGDIVFAEVGGAFFGYFWAYDGAADSFIKRISLTGSSVATVLTPPINGIDIVNSHRNLATDGTSLFWQEDVAVKKMPIGGGAITTLDPTRPNTPTAGVYLTNRNIVYADVEFLRFVPTAGAVTSPQVRTIAHASDRVATILPVETGVYWAETNGAIRLKRGTGISTIRPQGAPFPTSLASGNTRVGRALVWTESVSSNHKLRIKSPLISMSLDIADDPLGVAVSSTGRVFWGDDAGVHCLRF